MFVLKQHGRFKRNARLGFQRAVVVQAHMAAVGALRRDGGAKLIDHQAGRHALQPGLPRDGGEALDQKIGEGRPVACRQADAARAHAVAGRQAAVDH